MFVFKEKYTNDDEIKEIIEVYWTVNRFRQNNGTINICCKKILKNENIKDSALLIHSTVVKVFGASLVFVIVYSAFNLLKMLVDIKTSGKR